MMSDKQRKAMYARKKGGSSNQQGPNFIQMADCSIGKKIKTSLLFRKQNTENPEEKDREDYHERILLGKGSIG